MIPRIDAHHHLWRYSADDYGWIGDDMRALRRDFLLDELRSELCCAGIYGTVAVQARQTVEETSWLLSLATEGSPILGVVGWLPLSDPAIDQWIEQFRQHSRFKGLRHVVQAEPDGFLDQNAFNNGIRALRGTGLVYDILIYARQLPEAIRFVSRHPDQSFVLDHIGKPDIRNGAISDWRARIRELALRSNISCKLSGMVTEANWSDWSAADLGRYFEVILEAFGSQRIMAGSDWPVLTVASSYGQWWQIVEQWLTPLSTDEQTRILGGSAIRVYSLDATSPDNAGATA